MGLFKSIVYIKNIIIKKINIIKKIFLFIIIKNNIFVIHLFTFKNFFFLFKKYKLFIQNIK